jgi:hypothetical protein
MYKMNSDNYSFAKSKSPQGLEAETPFVSKVFNSINDINSGVYQNSGLTLLQYDLSTIYNSTSESFSDTSDLFAVIPIVMSAVHTINSTGAVQTAPTGGYALATLKNNFMNLIHQVEVVANGKVVNESQPYASVPAMFKLLSSMSATELKGISQTLGMSEVLDTPEAQQFVSAVATPAQYVASGGVGMVNNAPFPIYTTSNSVGSGFQSILSASQNANVVNESLVRRANRYVDTTGNAIRNNCFGAGKIMTLANLNQDLKPYYTVTSNYMTWYDYAVIPLKYICPCLDSIGLTRKLDLLVRMYVNTGTIQIPVSAMATDSTSVTYGVPVNSTFANTCPFTVNVLPATTANGGLANVTASTITAGLFVAKPPSTSISVTGGGTVNFGANISSSPLPASRMYYSLVSLQTKDAISYIESNRSKRLAFENMLFNQFNAIASGSSFSALCQSGVTAPRMLLVVPFLSSTQANIGFFQWASPYDPAPAGTSAPISLTNIQCTLGGKNVLEQGLLYSYEEFVQQVAPYSSPISDIGFQSGVISQKYWEQNRMYAIDLTRCREQDRITPRNLVVSFTNNSQVPIDVMVFTLYDTEIEYDVALGSVKRL